MNARLRFSTRLAGVTLLAAVATWITTPESPSPAVRGASTIGRAERSMLPRTAPAAASVARPTPVVESQAAVAMIESVGGSVVVSTDGIVRVINLTGCPIKNEDLQHLSETPHVSLLNLDGTTVTDEGLRQIRDLPELTTLRLCRTGITDAGLAHLDHLPKLSSIVLDDSAITDAGLLNLVHLKTLTSITCIGSRVSAASQELVHQHLPGCRVKH